MQTVRHLPLCLVGQVRSDGPTRGQWVGTLWPASQKALPRTCKGCGCGFLYWGTGWGVRIPGLPLDAWPRLSTWGRSTQARWR